MSMGREQRGMLCRRREGELVHARIEEFFYIESASFGAEGTWRCFLAGSPPVIRAIPPASAIKQKFFSRSSERPLLESNSSNVTLHCP